MIMYSLPYPPTVNGLFVEVAGKRIKTKPYRAWRDAAGWAIKQQQVGKVGKSLTGPVALLVECVKPDGRRRDISNLLKACEDLLVEMGVIEDDQNVMDIRGRWVRQGPPCLVTIVRSPAELDPIGQLAP